MKEEAGDVSEMEDEVEDGSGAEEGGEGGEGGIKPSR